MWVPVPVDGVGLTCDPLLVDGVGLTCDPLLVDGVGLTCDPLLVDGVGLTCDPPLVDGVGLTCDPPLVDGVGLTCELPVAGVPPPPDPWLGAGGDALAGAAGLPPVFLGSSARAAPSPQARTAASATPAQNALSTVLLKFMAASNETRIPASNERHDRHMETSMRRARSSTYDALPAGEIQHIERSVAVCRRSTLSGFALKPGGGVSRRTDSGPVPTRTPVFSPITGAPAASGQCPAPVSG